MKSHDRSSWVAWADLYSMCEQSSTSQTKWRQCSLTSQSVPWSDINRMRARDWPIPTRCVLLLAIDDVISSITGEAGRGRVTVVKPMTKY